MSETSSAAAGPRGSGALNSRVRALGVFGLALLSIGATAAHGEPVDEVVEALKVREYLLASEAECRVAAQAQAQRQVDANVKAALAARTPSAGAQARLDGLSETYAREACRLGIDEGLMQRYRATYRAALTDSEIEAALAFLKSPEGAKFAEAGLAANREVLPMISRRQESQVARAGTLFRSRLTSLLDELAREDSGAGQGTE